MRWPWVSRAVYQSAEDFWQRLLAEQHKTMETLLRHNDQYVDQIIELHRRLQLEKAPVPTAEQFYSCAAVGIAVGRTDGLATLHVGPSYVQLDQSERKRLASLLRNDETFMRKPSS